MKPCAKSKHVVAPYYSNTGGELIDCKKFSYANVCVCVCVRVCESVLCAYENNEEDNHVHQLHNHGNDVGDANLCTGRGKGHGAR